MIHIAQLERGALRVTTDSGVVYLPSALGLEPDIYERFCILQAADVGTSITGIGARVGPQYYWVIENEGDEEVIKKHMPLALYTWATCFDSWMESQW